MKARLRTRRPSDGELAAFADRRLTARRRRQVERAIAGSPELAARVRAQRRALEAIHRDGRVSAPAALRARLELPRSPNRAAARARRMRPMLAGAAAAAAALLAAILLGAGSAAPTVAQAAAFSQRPPQRAAPAPFDDSSVLADLRAGGLSFPYWRDRFGYDATGVRWDRLAGRLATTVYYSRPGGARVAYTIVAGAPLQAGSTARQAVRGGVTIWILGHGGDEVLTWLRRGHTCVLTGGATSLSTLLRLASWRAHGEIPY